MKIEWKRQKHQQFVGTFSLLPLLWIFDQCGHEPIVIGKATDCIQNEGDLKWWIACIAHLRAWFVEEHITISLIWRKNLIFYDKSTKVRHLIEQDHLEVRENWWRLKNHAKIMFDEVLHENVSSSINFFLKSDFGMLFSWCCKCTLLQMIFSFDQASILWFQGKIEPK